MKITTILAFIFVLIGCGTAYQKQGFSGGYSETQLAENIYSVSFKGNAYISKEKVADYTLLRSAELTLERGYKYFAIIDVEEYTQHSTYTTTPTYHTTGSAYGTGNYANFNATTYQTGGQTYHYAKPSKSNTILLLNEKPESAFVFDAEFIYNSIRKKYEIGQEAETMPEAPKEENEF